MEQIFFTADTHFGHKNIVHIGAGRPWENADQMNEDLIERWNARVQKQDRIYHLGDFSFMSKAKTAEVISRLRGHIHMIRGNHDHVLDSLKERFASFQSYKEIKVGDRRLVLFHFPILSWHQGHKGAWHLHGHCHGTLPDAGIPRMDVGVDCTNFKPIAFEEVAEVLIGRVWEPPDHHREKPMTDH